MIVVMLGVGLVLRMVFLLLQAHVKRVFLLFPRLLSVPVPIHQNK